MDRALLRWICLIAAILLAVVWLLSSFGTGFAVPHWVPPASVVALCLAVALP